MSTAELSLIEKLCCIATTAKIPLDRAIAEAMLARLSATYEGLTR